MALHVLSGQEARIEKEIETGAPVYVSNNRATRLLERVRTQKPVIDIERGLYFTESFRETEGQPLNLRWAKALYHYAENATVYIEEDQLLAGRAGKLGRYGVLYPELDGDILDEAIARLPERETSPFDIDPADAKIVAEVISPFWKGKTFHEDLGTAFPPDTRKLTYNADGTSRFIVNETASYRSSIQWVHDYEIVLQKGISGIKAEAVERLGTLDPDSAVDTMEKKPFLEATILTCDAIVLWAHRHAVLAREKAERDPANRDFYLKIAEASDWVPENPPRSFYEAVQSQWYVQMFSRIEQKTGTVISNGRMDQYLWPYYKHDIVAGIITADEAQELLESMWVAMSEYVDLYLSEAGGAFNEGYAHWEAVTIGGVDRDGVDATNDLSYLFLRSKRDFPLNYPDLAARVHTLSPRRYLYEVAETIKEGSGFPKLINDDEVIPLLLAKGATMEEANDYAVSGCSEVRMPNRDTYTSPCAYINFAAALEMTLFHGQMLKWEGETIGLDVGAVEDFETFDQFLDAYLREQKYFIRHAFIQQHEIIRLRARHFASPLGSTLHKLCRDSFTDLHQPVIPGGIDLGYFEFIGYGTVIDSLAAIRKFVYEERKVTIRELQEAIRHNFEGYEELRKLLQSAPAYGNNDPYADAIGKRLDREALDFTAKYSGELGIHLDLRLVPFTSHVPFGKVVSATPNGRLAWTPLSDGSSASQGADKNGPTAVLLSNFATKNQGYRDRAARLLNVKLSPSCVAGDTGTAKLVQFIQAWHDLRLWHIQFNVLNTETLREAQRKPEEYRNLLVRIAGYSAYFTELSRDLQDDIIARTEQIAI
ncbi:MAG: glycyl radical protein [Oscillospiraceae bacterium]|nr:glycyl radical protein [Oscillospiraceae bacterium]